MATTLSPVNSPTSLEKLAYDAIKNAILTFQLDPTLAACLGQNGRKAYETKYSWSIMETRLLNAYNDLLQKTEPDKISS